jgi:hypothetical protein
MSRGWPWATLAALLMLPEPTMAQGYIPDRPTVTGGFESRFYWFGEDLAVKSLAQWAIPLTAIVPGGRWTVDIGSWYASTSLERLDGVRETVTGFTDTQIRGSYVLGRDKVILTAVANLPTGESGLTPSEYAVLAAASSSFLAFPVNAYGSGASITAGGAGTFRAGVWNLGLAGSFRLSAQYTPFEDAEGSFTYQSGPEFRFRGGADRLIGSSRLAFGLTFSTFSTDEYSTGGGGTGVYRPGRRLIAEAYWSTLVGRSTVTTYVWDFFRWSGDSSGTSTGNRENLLAGGAVMHVPLRRTVTWEPSVEGRLSLPQEGSAALAEFGSAFRIRMSRTLTLVPVARFNLGRLEAPDPGWGHSIRGMAFSVYVRQSF